MTTAAPLRATPAHQAELIYESTPDASSKNQGTLVPRGPVTSNLSFYAPPADGSKPHNYVEKAPAGQPQRNFGDAWVPVTLGDIRGRESDFTLDNNAFATVSNVASEEKDFADDEHIKVVYYPEVEQLLRENVPGINRVILFDHTIRRATKDAHRAPVTRVHIDQTATSATARVRQHVEDAAEAEKLLKGRYRIINVWRPLNGPVVSFPLGFADSATVSDEDLIPVEHRYPDRNGETAAVKHNDKQGWYYWSGMTNEERLLLKCYDSDEKVGRWGRVPHTAFTDPRTPEGAPGRESIEVRALVFG
ncbi:hypothetical protein BJ546DRAFT_178481 [Cryomyces antarcticus]|uniref:Methyltransferase n=1 Tax=Cryomyces antarcticus TaxID=329879 RepID=A0ABR0MB19_9PEZI|nr:hypothetical protein LTR60_001114 [Cryomyces antarcticus]KAK5019847.1 hypothetical protein LTR39_000105 [Cryomyces antarcticus]KAK5296696.1 hypothetical protein LTR16_000172 [Cryomyces antarcticus]